MDETNLQRQIIFGVSDIGLNKAERAAIRMRELNPNTQIQTYQTLLNVENALDIIKDYDLIIDGTDNFPTRYLVNDACVLLNKPNIYGSIFRFEGQASVFNYLGGPCYRCLYPEPPPPGMVPSCAEGGVLGVLPAIIASIQATEAVKIITGIGKTLSGRLLLYDALLMQFEELTLHKNPQCSLCGEQPNITELIDYQQFCGIPAKPEMPLYEEISVRALKLRQDKGETPAILDIREPFEREICRLENSLHIPMQDVSLHLNDLNRDEEIIVYCKTGGRSAQVCDLLLQHGFTKPVNLKGGIMAWAEEVDLHMQKYWRVFLPVEHLFIHQSEPATILGNPLPVTMLVFRNESFFPLLPAIERGKVEGQGGFPVDTDTVASILLNPEPNGGTRPIFKNLGVTVETSLQVEVTAALEILDSAMVDGQPDITEHDDKVIPPQLQSPLGVAVHNRAAEIEQCLNQHRLGDLAHIIRFNQEMFSCNHLHSSPEITLEIEVMA